MSALVYFIQAGGSSGPVKIGVSKEQIGILFGKPWENVAHNYAVNTAVAGTESAIRLISMTDAWRG